MTTDKSNTSHEITSLYGVRGIAAIWIIAFHYSLYLNISKGLNLGFMKDIISHGFYGVEVFFVLSGFVLSYRYYDPFKKIRLSEYGLFLKNRIARIYPAYFFALCVVFLFFLTGALTPFVTHFGDYSFKYLFLNTAMMQAWIFLGYSKWSWNFPGWSVSVEWFLYLIAPVIFYLMNKRPEKISRIAILLVAYTLLCYFSYTDPKFFNLDSEKYGLIRGIAEFFIGSIFFTFLTTLPQKNKWFDVLTLMIVLIILACLLLRVNAEIVLIPIFLLIPLVTLSNGFIKKFLSSKPLWYLGEISYSLYIMQFPFQLVSNNVFKQSPLQITHFEILLLYLSQIILLIGIASIVHCLVEKPFREKIRKLSINPSLIKTITATKPIKSCD
jgi:peptidoglycan/LPS O-acetylase OafA/YrhL